MHKLKQREIEIATITRNGIIPDLVTEGSARHTVLLRINRELRAFLSFRYYNKFDRFNSDEDDSKEIDM